MAETLSDALESSGAERLSSGFVFTEGPLWDPGGFWHFVDVRASRQCMLAPGGTWVFELDGKRIGIIRTPEVQANLAFGGPDLRTLFLTTRTSAYTLRVKTPGNPHPYYSKARR